MTYGPLLQLPAGSRPSDVATGDFDHDGRVDLAITERGHDTLAIFRQQASGTFAARAGAKYYVPAAPASLVNLPLNGYGLTGADPTPPADDLAVGCADNAYFYLFDNLSTTPGVLTLMQRPVFLWQNATSVPLVNPRLVAGRFNNDPWFDLGYLFDASFPHGLGGMAIQRNSTSATFQQPHIQYSTSYMPAPNFTPTDFTLADLTGNGEPRDALLPSPATNEVIAIARTSPSSFNASWWDTGDRFLPSFGIGPVSAAAADIDGDGGVDLVAAHETSFDVVVQLHAAGGGFLTFSPARLTYALPVAPLQVIIADLNGDNRPELLVLMANATLRVYRNTGQVGPNLFDLATGAVMITNPDPGYMRLADLNADGRLDVVIPCRGDDTVDMFYSASRVLASAAAKPKASVQVYPNPAQTMLHLDWNGAAPKASATLLDLAGRTVRQWNTLAADLAVDDLPRGLYILRIAGATGQVNRRVELH